MIYLLGGNGFVGSGFARACESAGREYKIINRQNYESFIGKKCNILILAAGNSKKYLASQDPTADFDASVRSVRSSLAHFPCETCVLISSADVYPDSAFPSSTVENHEINPSAITPYGFHKYLAELCVRHSSKRWLVFRCGGFVGPLMKKNAIYDILHGEALWLHAESELQYIHTDNSAAIVFQLIDLGIRNEIFNLSAMGVVKLFEVMQWTGRHISARIDSPRIRCELDLSKVSAFVNLPDTRSTVRQYIDSVIKS
jgi:nucleoside-diphosphate-sugar epimerase